MIHTAHSARLGVSLVMQQMTIEWHHRVKHYSASEGQSMQSKSRAQRAPREIVRDGLSGDSNSCICIFNEVLPAFISPSPQLHYAQRCAEKANWNVNSQFHQCLVYQNSSNLFILHFSGCILSTKITTCTKHIIHVKWNMEKWSSTQTYSLLEEGLWQLTNKEWLHWYKKWFLGLVLVKRASIFIHLTSNIYSILSMTIITSAKREDPRKLFSLVLD